MAHRTTLEAERPAKPAKAPKKSAVTSQERERVFDAFRRWGYYEATLDPLDFFEPLKRSELVGFSGAVSYTHLTLPTICSV